MNPQRKQFIRLLTRKAHEEKSPLWSRVAEDLEKSRRRRVSVNLSKLDRLTTQGEVALVAGKVLASGRITHKLTVAAFAFSSKAREAIAAADGRVLNLQELLTENPKGSNVKLIGG